MDNDATVLVVTATAVLFLTIGWYIGVNQQPQEDVCGGATCEEWKDMAGNCGDRMEADTQAFIDKVLELRYCQTTVRILQELLNQTEVQ